MLVNRGIRLTEDNLTIDLNQEEAENLDQILEEAYPILPERLKDAVRELRRKMKGFMP